MYVMANKMSIAMFRHGEHFSTVMANAAPDRIFTKANAMTDETFGERARRLRKLRGLSQQVVADRAGTSRSYLSTIENDGSEPGLDLSTKLAHVLGWELIHPDATNSGGGVWKPPFGTTPDMGPLEALSLVGEVVDPYAGMVEVRVYAEVAAGEPMDYSGADDTVIVPAMFAPSEERGEVLIRARGESMLEFGIEDGDYVVVELRKGGVAASGEIVIAWFNNGLTIKRWIRRPGRKLLEAGNVRSVSYEIGPNDQYELVAIVRRWYRVSNAPRISG